jgi:hypothetical protein
LNKFVYYLLLFFIVPLKSVALQCEAVSDKDVIERSTHVFTAKIISKNNQFTNLSIIKIYKNNLNTQIQLTFTSPEIAKTYKLMAGFKEGESFLIATTREKNADPNIVKIGVCGLRKTVRSAKATINWLERRHSKK